MFQVVLNVGLCLALFDIKHIGDSHLFPGDGSSHTEVLFRFIVFRPIIEEIVIGKIKSCSRDGVQGDTFILIHSQALYPNFNVMLC